MERQSLRERARGFSQRMCKERGARACIIKAWVSSRVQMKTPVMGM